VAWVKSRQTVQIGPPSNLPAAHNFRKESTMKNWAEVEEIKATAALKIIFLHFKMQLNNMLTNKY